ncbi:hypothetical protein AVI51_08355 [Piscirickettsia salmonis]|uniref:Uncharacterized protein n=1 Tax=Piscirickettsia salmonis TaxID=1238 RepID=A0A9Q5VFX1_PISSA|nr:hypothetical protein [Piscirickettsia salmonis]ALA23924.1 GTPase Era [Piscirickettsia salmonis]APS44339.1 hypothetical protein AVI48_08170 [Piscirickettsia salmonis]APS47700.1 hypothetical protein AVI49_08780 [Piscirickettsia salmonis]APS50870.1 hypothetical protein AVI50_08450 [Piscirickettsia salmonis]APS54073.1 hypothetical protein AVI51_08355 [Piscirickettsia salmonis]
MFTDVFEKTLAESKEAQNWLAEATKEVFSLQQAMMADWAEWTRVSSVRSSSVKTVEEWVDLNLSSISELTQRSSKAMLDSVTMVSTFAAKNPFYQVKGREEKISKKKTS